MNSLMNQLEQKEQKIMQLKKELSHQTQLTKEKEGTILKFISDVHNCIQYKDEKEYIGEMKKLNELYVHSNPEILDKLKKDPETIEEINRQLQYMEKSIATLRVKMIKGEKQTKVDVHRRTMENTQLIQDLNNLRIENKQLKAENYDLLLRLQKYEPEEGKMGESGMEKPFSKNTSIQSMSKGSIKDESVPSLLQRPRSGIKNQPPIPQKRGKLFKGTPFEYKKGNMEDKQRVAELMAQLEENNQQILYQKLEIRELKQRILRLLEDKGIETGGTETPQSRGGMREGSLLMSQENQRNSGVDIGFLPKVTSSARIP